MKQAIERFPDAPFEHLSESEKALILGDIRAMRPTIDLGPAADGELAEAEEVVAEAV